MATKKINRILIIQGWAILWVVIGHAPLLPIHEMPQPVYVSLLYDIAYSFHMPLFIFISGYLFRMTRIERHMPYREMISEKLRRLGIPFVVFTIIAMAVKSVFSADMARPATFSVGEFVNAVIFPGSGPLSELWFVATLMWYFALRPLWEILDSKPVATIIVLTILFYMPEFTENNLLCYQQVIHYAIFFYLGTIARSKKISGTPSLRYIAAICTTAIVYPFFVGGDFRGTRNNSSRTRNIRIDNLSNSGRQIHAANNVVIQRLLLPNLSDGNFRTDCHKNAVQTRYNSPLRHRLRIVHNMRHIYSRTRKHGNKEIEQQIPQTLYRIKIKRLWTVR